eukprot:7247555-Pyramimonas_sp.AAC.1
MVVVVLLRHAHPQLSPHCTMRTANAVPTNTPRINHPYAKAIGPNPCIEWYCGSSPPHTAPA